ncbi:phospholipase D zeta 1-like isoform X2 [Wolffia australiana]
MSLEKFTSEVDHPYVKMQAEPTAQPPPHSIRPQGSNDEPVFEELPKATIVSVSRPDVGDISPLLLSYTIEFRYKQFKWRLVKKASQVFYLHFALKKRVLIEEFHEKQEQVKEWLQNIGIGEHTAVTHEDEEVDDDILPLHHDESFSFRNRNVPSRAVLPIIRPAIGRQHSVSERAKVAMQGYLNHFLGNLDIVNSREVCKFLEVSRLSFSPEYGPKLKEDYITVKHLPNIPKKGGKRMCFSCNCFGTCCNGNWQKVWAVLKPGFLALLDDPFSTNLLDIILFDVIPSSDGEDRFSLAKETKERNPLRYGFMVSCGNRSIKIRLRSNAKVKEWVAAINDAGLRPPEGWGYPHRFGSFTPPRGLTDDGSLVQWFIDGKAAFDAIASTIEEAKSEIFITGWWLCPELFLRRPFQENPSSRLDALLQAKAKQGVQIYILLYKEVALALKINSVYSKRRLLSIHENVKVLRYPDHFSSGVYLWSHHEKIVIVDHQICYLGGLDLCFGRYDTPEHRVSDFPPSIWPGKDYYNPRESEPNSWEETMRDELDRTRYPRMPWHDVHCALWGPPCRDVARHFVQRWNYAKRSKAANEQAIPLLMPHHHMVIPHYMGKSKDTNVDCNVRAESKNELATEDSFFSRFSPRDIPLLVPQDAEEHQYSREDLIRNVSGNTRKSVQNGFSFNRNKSQAFTTDMPMKGFVDETDFVPTDKKQLEVKAQDKEWWETQQRTGQIISADEIGQVGPCTPCKCQIIRSVSQWSAGTMHTEESIHNAYFSVIEKAEHFVYIENQFFISGLSGDDVIKNRILEALYQRIRRAEKEKKCFRVIIVIPLLPGFQGGVDDGGAASVRALLHWQYRTICRGQNSILQNLFDALGPKAHDYISFYGLRNYGRLTDGGALATNQVYVHSKIMIVDDCIALISSANINDRSLLGSRDSEIGVLIEDKEFIDSYMNGKPWKAGKFAFSLRLSLWAEHLGLHMGEINRICDPVADATYKEIWIATAKTNTAIYQDVFACIPNDFTPSRAAIRQSIGYWKDKVGHTTIDLGIAPDKLETYENGNIKATDTVERLESVKGLLVSFPLEFMSQEDLRPVFNESEFYAAPQVFH